METLADAVKTHLLPGSTTFLIFSLTVCLVVLRWRRRWAIRGLIALTAFYWVISTPLFAQTFEGALSGSYVRVDFASVPSRVDAIVILGGGSETYSTEAGSISAMSDATSLRVLEGARLAMLLPEAPVIVSGGPELKSGRSVPETEPMIWALLDLGVMQDRISAESQSGNTHEQAQLLGPILETHSAQDFLLVTSPTHMWRALATFRNQGLEPQAAPSAQHSATGARLPLAVLPSSSALASSRMAFRELFAITYYAVRGWLTP
jgi:uncharacterized SAM-binding protein YcdF (DUF218 family)